MSATNFTPIQLYRTTTAAAVPTAGNLAAGELAINLTDEKLYFKNAAGVVKLLASNSGSLGSVTSVDVSGGTTGLTTSGGPITSSGTITLAGTLGVANGGTGVTTSTGTTNVVLSNSPTLVTPTLGVASATSIANALGAVGTPSYTFTGDLNTGMWSPAADTIAFSTNGGERMRLSSVGATLSQTAGTVVGFGTGTFTFDGVSILDYGLAYTTAGSANTVLSAFGNIKFTTGRAEAMRIDQSGNVGIGTSSPSTKLQITVAPTGTTDNGMRVTDGTRVIQTNITGNTYSYIGIGASETMLYSTGNPLNIVSDGQPIKFIAGTAERMRITSAGDVGIGISSPGAKLHVATPASGAGVIIRYASGTNNPGLFISTIEATSVCEINATGSTGNNNLAIAISGTERIRVNSDGNVGIGTTAPGSALQVNGNIRVSNGTGFTTGNSLIRSIQSMSGSSNQFVSNSIDFYTAAFTDNGQIAFSTGTTERMRIDGSGRLIIGASSSFSAGGSAQWGRLQVVGNAFSGFGGGVLALGRGEAATSITAGEEIGIISFSDNAGNTFAAISSEADAAAGTNDYPGRISFSTTADGASSPTERARIDSSGNLLVGTTSVSNLSTGAASNPGFGVAAGQVRSQWNADANAYWSKLNVTSSTVLHDFYVAGTRVGVITTNGSTTTYGTSSDARLKENIADADDAANLIDAIQVRKFDWKTDNSHQRYGFVAQELLEVAPEAVTNLLDPDEMMGVDYSKLVPMLVKEIQSLRARVAQLEGN